MPIMQINSRKFETAEEVINDPLLNQMDWDPNNPINSSVEESVNSKVKKSWSRAFNFLSTLGLGAAAGGTAVAALVKLEIVSLSLSVANPLFIAIAAVTTAALLALVAIKAGSAIARKSNIKHAEKDLEAIKTSLEEHKKLYANDGTGIWPNEYLVTNSYNPEHFKDPTYRQQYMAWFDQAHKTDVDQKLNVLSEGCKTLDATLNEHRPVINCSWQEAIDVYKERFSTLRQQVVTSYQQLDQAQVDLQQAINGGADAGVQQRHLAAMGASYQMLTHSLEQLDKAEKEFFSIADRRATFIDKQIQAQELYVRELKAR